MIAWERRTESKFMHDVEQSPPLSCCTRVQLHRHVEQIVEGFAPSGAGSVPTYRVVQARAPRHPAIARQRLDTTLDTTPRRCTYMTQHTAQQHSTAQHNPRTPIYPPLLPCAPTWPCTLCPRRRLLSLPVPPNVWQQSRCSFAAVIRPPSRRTRLRTRTRTR